MSANGTRRDITLGVYNSPESKREYQRVLEDLEGIRAKVEAGAARPSADITVNELCVRYLKHADEYYRDDEGNPTSEVTDLKYAIRIFREGIGDTPAREFGPLAFKAMRERMVRKRWSRPYVNKQCGRVKRIIRFGVEEELLPADRWEALRAVKGLASGRTTAPDTEPIGPVEDARVRAVLPLVRPPVRAMLELLEMTGMRPGEACRARPSDIDMTGEIWLYRPHKHKTKHRGKKRVVPLGPRAQELLKAWAPAEPVRYYFSPARDAEVRHGDRSAARCTPRYASHMARNAGKRKPNGKRKPGERYTPHGVAVAVSRACERAKVEHWHPNQLRHLFATKIRKAHGLEAAQVLLGHARADVTEIYAEKNLSLAVKVASEIG